MHSMPIRVQHKLPEAGSTLRQLRQHRTVQAASERQLWQGQRRRQLRGRGQWVHHRRF